jgi:hypothetical protein
MSKNRKPLAARPHFAVIDTTAKPVQAGKKIRKDAESSFSKETGYELNAFIRAALFRGANGTARREYVEYLRLASLRNITMSYKGTELVIFDLYVWMKIARLVRSLADKMPDGRLIYKPVSFSLRSLCIWLDLEPNPATRERVKVSLDALWSAEFQLSDYSNDGKTEGWTVRQFRLLSSRVKFERRAGEERKKWVLNKITLNLDGSVLELFEPGHYSALDLKLFKKLMKTPLAAWLYAHLATHDDFSKGMRYATIRELAALDNRPLHIVRDDVRHALTLLEAEGLIGGVISDEPEKFELVSYVRRLATETFKPAIEADPLSTRVAESDSEDKRQAEQEGTKNAVDSFVNWLDTAPSQGCALHRLNQLTISHAIPMNEAARLKSLIRDVCFEESE